jgi:hypothetical protein
MAKAFIQCAYCEAKLFLDEKDKDTDSQAKAAGWKRSVTESTSLNWVTGRTVTNHCPLHHRKSVFSHYLPGFE